MIGRAAIGYPWIFKEIKHYVQTGEILDPPTIEERIAVCKKHLLASIDWKGTTLGILEMRRHYTNYLKGLPNIKEHRMKLVNCTDINEIDAVLQNIQKTYTNFVMQEVV